LKLDTYPSKDYFDSSLRDDMGEMFAFMKSKYIDIDSIKKAMMSDRGGAIKLTVEIHAYCLFLECTALFTCYITLRRYPTINLMSICFGKLGMLERRMIILQQWRI
jgi:hypothetical protein